MGMRRRIEAKVNATLAQAQGVLSQADRAILRVSAKVEAILDEILDGADVVLVKRGDATLMDFFSCKVAEFPVRIQIDVKGEDDKP